MEARRLSHGPRFPPHPLITGCWERIESQVVKSVYRVRSGWEDASTYESDRLQS